MALMDFIKKQFIDILEWTESGDGTLAWRYPMADNEIQYGGSLTVRESQMAVFVNEGKVADVFGPGMYKLTTQTLPVLTYLKNWDKLFQSPFKSDVYFFSTRQQLDRRWGTTQPVTIRDKDFGAVRLRAFGNYAYRIADPKLFHTAISGTRDSYTVDDLDGQLRGLMLQHISDAVAQSGVPFLDLAANQIEFAKPAARGDRARVRQARPGARSRDDAERQPARGAAEDPRPEDRHGHGRRRHGQVHAVPDRRRRSRSSPKAGGGGGGSGIAGDAMGLGAGVALGQVMAQQLGKGLQQPAPAAEGAAAPAGIKPEEIMATIEKLGELKTKGLLTDDEFNAKKAELLKKLA